jgi:CBS domain containing-hemolysin-like protein
MKTIPYTILSLLTLTLFITSLSLIHAEVQDRSLAVDYASTSFLTYCIVQSFLYYLSTKVVDSKATEE